MVTGQHKFPDGTTVEYKVKQKSWLWKLTIFAVNNYTTIGHTIFYPKGFSPDEIIIHHECIHMRQMDHNGLLKFLFLYLFLFPFLYNPFRWKWEYEAYTKANKWNDEHVRKILRSSAYGWLVFHGKSKSEEGL